MGPSEVLGELIQLRLGWMDGWGLTSIGHHDFLDWSILALAGSVGEAREGAGPLHGQQAEAASDHSVAQHPERNRGHV